MNNSLRKEQQYSIVVFIIIPIILLILFIIIALITMLYYSFTDYDGLSKTSNFIGLNNYRVILSDDFLMISKNNTYYLISAILQVIDGFIFVVITFNLKYFKKMLFILLIIPLALNMVAITIIFKEFFAIDGSLNMLLNTDFNLLANKKLVNWTFAFVSFYKFMPLSYIMFYIAFNSISRETIEASKINGANSLN